jgi:hypothetical protein
MYAMLFLIFTSKEIVKGLILNAIWELFVLLIMWLYAKLKEAQVFSMIIERVKSMYFDISRFILFLLIMYSFQNTLISSGCQKMRVRGMLII